MFTGLVADIGRVAAVDATPGGVGLRIDSLIASEIARGDSVAVNGVCLTATEVDPRGESFSTELMHETLRRSSLRDVAPRDMVNLELPLRASDRLGGHVVQGHVDGLGTVEDVRQDGFARVLTVAAEPGLLRYVVEKGSIALDGVSLTVSAVDDESLTVALIPETLEWTTLGGAVPGGILNLEVDVLAKHVEKLLPVVR